MFSFLCIVRRIHFCCSTCTFSKVTYHRKKERKESNTKEPNPKQTRQEGLPRRLAMVQKQTNKADAHGNLIVESGSSPVCLSVEKGVDKKSNVVSHAE